MLQKTAIFTKKGDEKARARINKEMEKVLSFEKQLIKVSVKHSHVQDYAKTHGI